LKPKSGNPPPAWFWGSTKKPTTDFEVKPGETVTTGFEDKPEKIITIGFEAKPEKIDATGFKVKPEKTVPVVLRPNLWQIVNLGFEVQPRNMHSTSPRARCKPHTASPDLLIVRPSPVIYIKSPTPDTILIIAHCVAPATCTTRHKQTWFFTQYKDKGKTTKISWIRIQTSPSQWLITIKPRNW
jgi:hypothetical protein